MRKIILGLSILSIILTAGVIAVEASDDVSWKEKIKAKMGVFKEMTPEERKIQKEEAVAAMAKLKKSEEWQNANKEERMEMLKKLDVFPLRGFGKAVVKKFDFDKEKFSEKHQAVMAAIESGDYEAWLKATEGRKNAETVTEENFSRLIEAYKLMKEGDKKGAKAIFEELGVKRHPRAMHAFGKGFKKGYQKGLSECQNK